MLLGLGAGSVGAADVETISRGSEVVLEDHLVPGKYVLFDFYADWCGPCRALEPHLNALAGRHDDRLALRKIDVVNWDSAVARQHRLSSIPHLVLYGPDGVRLAAGDAGSVLRRLEADLGDLGGPSGRPSALVPVLVAAAIFAVALGLVRRRRRGTAPPAAASAGTAATLPPVDTAADPGDPAIWFALLQGSLEGPFTRAQLAELVRRGTLDRNAEVRRRGDAGWRAVHELLD